MTHHTPIPSISDSGCTHPANDLIEAVAFGYASAEETRIVQDHIATCPTCADAWENALFAAAVLPMAAPDPPHDLPEHVWSGIEQRIASPELSSPSLTSPAPRTSAVRVSWLVAATLAVMTLAAGLLIGWLVFDRSGDEPNDVAEIAISDPATGATGTVRYFGDQGVIVLNMDDMPAAPAGQVYQVWMISGDTPTPVGVFDAASGEFAAAGDPADFDAMAITVEPGPIGNALPTTDPVMVIDLAQLTGD